MRSLTLISDTARPCGVEDFARTLAVRLAAAQPHAHATMQLTGQPGEIAVLRRVLADVDALILNLPLVAWKRRIVAPARAMLAARRAGRQVVLMLHEWTDLDWKRRATYLACLPSATRILFSSPLVRAGFEADAASRLAPSSRGLLPIPPNMRPPADLPRTALSAQLADFRRDADILIGSFGSIYPGKHPAALLDVVAALRDGGVRARCVFLGSYIRAASSDPEAGLQAAIAARGLDGAVLVSGYIATPAEVFAALAAVDVIVYRFAEGLTSRRGSVLACLQGGRPVLVNAPAGAREFDHHQAFRKAMTEGALTLVAHDAPASEMAAAIRRLAAEPARVSAVDFDAAWADVLEVLRGA